MILSALPDVGSAVGSFEMNRFRVVRDGERYDLVRDAGERFYSLGVDCVTPSGSRAALFRRYGSDGGWLHRWAACAEQRLTELGFNTLGAWHHPVLYQSGLCKTVEIRMSAGSPVVNAGWGQGFPDVFDPGFEDAVHRALSETFSGAGAMLLEDPTLLGFYTDNELHFWGSRGVWGENEQGNGEIGLVDDYIGQPADKPAKRRWTEFVAKRYGTIEQLNLAWGSEYTSFEDIRDNKSYRAAPSVLVEVKRDFLRLIAETYFRTTSEALACYAKGSLNLGCRCVGSSTPGVVLDVMKDYVDVVTLNFYSMDLPEGYLAHVHGVTERPLMITEFSFCAGREAGFGQNTNGAQSVLVKDQKRRAECYREFVSRAARLPFVVGTHWFAYYDFVPGIEPLVGNYGFFRHDETAYLELCDSARDTHAAVIRERCG
jgi:hypothetical protein